MALAPAPLSWRFSVVALVGWLGERGKTPAVDGPESVAAQRASYRALTKPGILMGCACCASALAEETDSTVAGVAVRSYVPRGALPGTLLFFHGGGFVIGDIETYDVFARELAVRTRRCVVSVEYRLAPEHPYPAAVQDCLAVTRYFASQAGTGPIVLCGDSAGGNLAAVVANTCSGPCDGSAAVPIAAQVLFYPVVDFVDERPSFARYGGSFFLSSDRCHWFKEQYTPTAGYRSEPDISPIRSPPEVLRRTAPAFISLAQCDALHDDGAAYAEALRAAGTHVDVEVTAGVPHGFAMLLGLPEAQAAVRRACMWLEGRWGMSAVESITPAACEFLMEPGETLPPPPLLSVGIDSVGISVVA